MLRKVSIEHFKGFYERQSVEFAVPDGENKGSGLTLIVGPNNAGKTTLIESLLLTGDKRFKEAERHLGESPVVEIENNTGAVARFTNVNQGSVVSTTGEAHGVSFELIPSRRFWNHQFNGEWDFGNLIQQSINTELRNADAFNIGPILKKIQRNPAFKSSFDTYLRRVIPHFTDWTIDTNDSGHDYVKYQTISGGFHQANLLGDGIISLFRIVAHLIHDQVSTFIIDEPELSLHPAAQKRLAAIISELATNKQIVVATHSPYFVDWQDFTNGAKFVRLNKIADSQCTTHCLDNQKNYGRFIAGTIGDHQKPQLLDVAAKEILFNDQVLFLEGQEDVGIIRKWYVETERQLDYELFGYGVGGEANMKLFLEIARDLGLEKVAALYDSNTASFTADQAEYTDYHLCQLTTEDIRDKTNQCPSANHCPYGKDREGTFNSDGSIKAAQEGDFIQVIEGIETFMRS